VGRYVANRDRASNREALRALRPRIVEEIPRFDDLPPDSSLASRKGDR
jgi:hypothetical protein